MDINGKSWAYKTVKLNELCPNKKNPRTISKEKFEKLQAKIKAVGFHSPIKLDNDGVIIGGNQRFAALSSMGYGDVEVPVMYPLFQLTQHERDQIIITDNISDGEWDTEILANEFEASDLVEWGLDIPWKDEPVSDEEAGEDNQIDIQKSKVKIIFNYTDSKEIIDAFLKEMHEKYPELLYTVEIHD